MRHDRRQVLGAHPGREQRLVRVAERGLGDRESRLLPQRVGEARRSELEQLLPGSRGRRGVEVDGRQLAGRVDRVRAGSVGLVDGHVGEPAEDLGAAVARLVPVEQLGTLIDEARREVSGDECRVLEHRLQEGDVGGDTADAELRQTALGARHRGREVAAAGRHLGQHRVEVRADLRTGLHRAAVETDSGAAGRAVGGDLARVRAEVGRRVLGRDARLQGRAVQLHGVLRQPQLGERGAGRDAHLRLHQVDVGDLFGDGVLDLDARVHLDEDVLPGALPRGVEQELDRSGVDVADRLRERDRVAVHRLAGLLVEVGGRGDLHHLLVTTLHRAVALEQVDRLARRVGEDLDLDVTRADDGLLDEHGRVAEGAVGLAHGGFECATEFFALVDATHSATATAGDRLGEDGEPDLVGTGEQHLDVGRRRGRLQHGHAGGDRVLLGGDLVSSHLQHVAAGADEGDAVVGSRLGEVGVLGEESVAGVDGVGASFLGDTDDLAHVEVGADRVALLADQVGLVGLETVHRVAILVGIHGHRLGAQLVGSTESTDRDFTAVRYQDLLEHSVLSARG